MGENYIVYNNKLWKRYMFFEYRGEPEEFTLQSDTYLFVVNGARGGINVTNNPFIPWGGTTYGILDLDHTQTFYAVVGGEGENSTYTESKRTAGGYNGGGEGGKAISVGYHTGSGGGGGSDVRLYGGDDATAGYMSRIIVAGGGGGAAAMSWNNDVQDFMAFGGGPMSGWVVCGYADGSHNAWKRASQSDGNAFGYGGNAQDRASWGGSGYSAEGQSGGGGGWYGGYAVKNRNTDVFASASNGSGGSCYVLTESSYKPEGYMSSYEDIMPTLYFRDYMMLPYQAFDGGSISIYKESKASPKTGDYVYIPYTGTRQSLTLIPGQYRIKCYGGDGATRYQCGKAAKGGYAEGVLNLQETKTLYAHVGSSAYLVGMGTSSSTKDQIFDNKISFNVNIGSYNNMQFGSMMGGGATDVRLYGGDDATAGYMSRIIVAGGGGGQGANNRYGGNGGGTSGNWYNGGGYGTNNGPGSQTSTPSQSGVSGGGFGYNGIGTNYNDGYGGSGGNGWFGGNGTDADVGDDDVGGCGGSGYVLTETSYKPTGYVPDEKYWLTETVLTTGGNNVRGMTKIEIEVIKATALYIIAQDSDGYKTYNTANNQWEIIPVSEITPEVFDTYGVESKNIKDDTGLLDRYRFIVYDLYELGVNTINATVVPLTQHITLPEHTNSDIIDYTYDADVDENSTINISYEIEGIAENRVLTTDITFDMNDIPTMESTLYMVQYQIRNRQTSYYYPEPLEKHIDDLDLIPVGSSSPVPNRYKTHIGSLMPDGSTPITSVLCSSSCEYKRNIYTASLINNSVIRFTRFNIIENRAYIIRDDVPKNTVDPSGNGSCGGSLLVDDRYMYLFNSYNDVSGYTVSVVRVPLDPSEPYTRYSLDNRSENICNGFGEAYWLSPNEIVTMKAYGFLIFNTKTLNFTSKVSDSGFGTRNDMSVGKYSIICHWFDDRCGLFRRYDKNNFTFHTEAQPFTVELGVKISCYNDGIFYVTMKGHLYIINENSDFIYTLKEDVLTPYTSLVPKTITYSDDILYITCANSNNLFIYDLTAKNWISMQLPFNIGAYGNQNWFRPTQFKNGFFFIGNLKLLVVNYNNHSKYNVGQKGSILLLQTNDSIHDYGEYDERFITINNIGINFHTGDIQKRLTLIDAENLIYTSEYFNKTEYKTLIEYNFTVEED